MNRFTQMQVKCSPGWFLSVVPDVCSISTPFSELPLHTGCTSGPTLQHLLSLVLR